MDQDNDNEGFEVSKETFDFIGEKVQMAQVKIIKSSTQRISLDPPISTYTQINNFPTPKILNRIYSTSLNDDSATSPKPEAWVCNTDHLLEKQFSSCRYEEIYRKFPEDRTNYKYFKQYGCDEYKTFTDEEQPFDFKNKTMQIWEQYFQEKQQTSESLKFCSSFQCGNLEKVYQKKDIPFEYYLVISNDTNSVGFNQWFYFKVFNPNDHQIKAKFIIVNNNKMTIPCIDELGINYFSVDKYKYHKIGWSKLYDGVTSNAKNNLRRQNLMFNHTLEFEVKIMSYDTVYYSLALPYSFSKLKEITNKTGFSVLGLTFCGNPIFVYRTGNPQAQKSIVVTARQHPSETSSSFVAQGLLAKLETMTPLIQFLKKKYYIVVVPMANPDGVIHGNSRTNLLGFDINRKWDERPDKAESFQVHIIYHNLLKKLQQIEYLIDLHGHSKKLNSFAYFSTKKSVASILALEMAEKLPWFKTADCQIAQQTPLNTLRWLGSFFLGIEKSITIETSIHGWSDENNKIHPFTPQKMQMIGSCFIEILARLEIQKKSNRKYTKIIEFSKENECSDSDPEADYMKEARVEKVIMKEKSTKKMTSPRKMRIKTLTSTFYRPTLSSTIRDRLKTQLAIEKVDLQINPSPLKLRPRKKTATVKYCRVKTTPELEEPSQRSQKRKIYNECSALNNSLTLKSVIFSQHHLKK